MPTAPGSGLVPNAPTLVTLVNGASSTLSVIGQSVLGVWVGGTLGQLTVLGTIDGSTWNALPALQEVPGSPPVLVYAITAAGGALPSPTRFYRAAPNSQDGVVADTKESIDLMVKYWNDHAFDAADYAPEIRNLMGNDPKNQFYGRHLTYKLIDGGSNQCPEKTTSAAHSAAQDDKAFVVFNNLDGASPAGAYNMAAALPPQNIFRPGLRLLNRKNRQNGTVIAKKPARSFELL